MRIEESKIYEFRFPFHGGELAIPVRAQSREEAGQALRRHLNDFMIELATEFPLQVPQAVPPTENSAPPAPPPVVSSYALELQIEEIVKQLMPLKKPKGAQTIPIMVKAWTGFEFSPENYLAIIDELKKQL